MEQKKFYWD